MSGARDNPTFAVDGSDSEETTERELRSQNRQLRARLAEMEARLEELAQTDRDSESPIAELSEALRRIVVDKAPPVKGYKQPKKEVPLYRGSSDVSSITSWLSSAEMYLKAAHGKDASRDLWLESLPALLDGDAAKWFDEEQSKAPFQSWSKFVERLFTAFTGSGSKASLLDRLTGFKQGRLSIIDFIAQFKQLVDALEASGAALCDEIRVKMFVENLAPNYQAQARKYLLDYPTLHGAHGSSGRFPMFSGLTTYLVQWSSNLSAEDSASLNYVGGLSQAGHVVKKQGGSSNEGHPQLKRKKNFNKQLCKVCGEKYTPGHFCPRYCGRCSQFVTTPCRCPPRKAALNNISTRAYSTARVPPSGKSNAQIVPPNDGMAPEAQELSPSGLKAQKNEQLQQIGTCHPGASVTQKNKLTFSFIGSIEGKTVRILMDSGAEDDFISESFVRTHGLPGQRVAPMRIIMADGTAKTSDTKYRGRLVIKQEDAPNCVSDVWLRVAPLENQYDVLLGQPWLSANQAGLCYKTNSVYMQKFGRVLHSSSSAELMSHQAMVRAWRTAEDGDLFGMVWPFQCQRDGLRVFSVGTTDRNKHENFVIKMKTKYSNLFVDGLPPENVDRKDGVMHKIDLLPGSIPVAEPLRRMAPKLLEELKAQLDELLEKKFIQPSASPYGAPVLFAKKKNGKLRLCVDYRALNDQTVKNKYPIPRTDDLLDQLQGARYFTSLDLTSGYHQIPIRPEDRCKTAFRTRYGSFEFLVMPFGLTNAPATFQAWMNTILGPYLDSFVIVYLDDILIYSKTEEEHEKHVEMVLDTLSKNKAFLQLSKCTFFQERVKFLGYELSPEGISTDKDLVSKILDFPAPETKTNVRSFLGAVGFYRRFIKDFASIAAPLFDITKENIPFCWTSEHQSSFNQLKKLLTTAPVLKLADPAKRYYVFTDASDRAIGGVLMQQHDRVYHPVAFFSRKLKPAEVNYPVHDREFMAVVEALLQWKHYLYMESPVVYTDHRPLIHLKKQKDLNPRQVRWMEKISAFDADIQYIEGRANLLADLLSRPPRHINFVASELQPDAPMVEEIRTKYEKDKFIGSLKKHLHSKLPVPSVFNSIKVKHVVEKEGLLYYAHPGPILRLIIPDDEALNTTLCERHHDSVYSAHPGRDKMYQQMKRYYYWPDMFSDIAAYVQRCQVCQVVKDQNQRHQGLLKPLPVPRGPWEEISMDFIVELPATSKKHTLLIVFVDRFTKMVHVAPAFTPCDAQKTACMFIQDVFRYHGMPRTIVSDRDSRFVSSFWQELMSRLGCQTLMSTAYHPQTDGQTERSNRILEEMIRCYCDEFTDTWDEHLDVLEFAYNNSYQSSIKNTPFYLNHGRHPALPTTMALGLEEGLMTDASQLIQNMATARYAAKHYLEVAQARQAAYANIKRKALPLKVGDEVLLATNRLKMRKLQKATA